MIIWEVKMPEGGVDGVNEWLFIDQLNASESRVRVVIYNRLFPSQEDMFIRPELNMRKMGQREKLKFSVSDIIGIAAGKELIERKAM